jgi:NAD-dependent DNA ligase
VKARTKSSLKDSRSERTGPLMRENFVITGEFSDFNKDDFIEIIQHLGGSYSKTMVKKCTVLIQGAFCVDRFMKQTSQPVSETTKSRDARSMKIRIVPYSEID